MSSARIGVAYCSRYSDLTDGNSYGWCMTGYISKNRLVKLGYDPRTEIGHRRHFFANKAIPQLSLDGAINALKLLIFEVKSLEKGYPNTLKSMEADLFQLKREYATTLKAKASAKRKKPKKSKKTETIPLHLLDRPQKGSIRLTTGQQ